MPSPDQDRPASLRSARDVAREVLMFGPISRRSLSARLGLSSASLTRLVKPMIDRGVLREGMHVTDGQVGRPTRPLDIVVESNTFVGVTVLPDEVRAVLTDFRANEIASTVVPLASTDPGEVAVAVETALRMLQPQTIGRSDRITGLGVAVDGRVGDGCVHRSTALGWTGVDLGGLLASRLGLPVVVENDIVAVTSAEDWFGAGRGLAGFAVLSLGRSLGYGLVLGGRTVITPDTGIAVPVHPAFDAVLPPPDGLDGGTAPAGSLLTVGGIAGALSARLGRTVDYEEALALVGAGDPQALEVADAAAAIAGRVVGAITCFALVNTVVLAGEVSAIVDHRTATLLESARAFRDPSASPLSVVVRRPGGDDTSRGAAAVAIRRSVADGSFVR